MQSKPLIGLALVLMFGLAQAQVYRWVDDKGRVRYSDTPPPPSAKQVDKKQFTKAADAPAPRSYELERAVNNAPVTLFSHPTCKDACDFARTLLNKRGVPFKEVSVVDPSSRAQLLKISGGLDVPLLVVGALMEKQIDRDAYSRLLDSAGYPPEGVLAAGKQGPPPVKSTAQPVGGAAVAGNNGKNSDQPLGPYAPRPLPAPSKPKP